MKKSWVVALVIVLLIVLALTMSGTSIIHTTDTPPHHVVRVGESPTLTFTDWWRFRYRNTR